MWSGWQGTTGTTPAETPETPATSNLSGVWSVYYSIIHSLNNGLNFQLPSSFHKLGWCLCDWRRSSFLVMDGHPVTLLLCLSSSVLRHIEWNCVWSHHHSFQLTITHHQHHPLLSVVLLRRKQLYWIPNISNSNLVRMFVTRSIFIISRL